MSKNPVLSLSDYQIEEQKEYLRKSIRRAAFKHPTMDIPTYAERYIKIQAGPKTGAFSLASFPPIEEPMYHMSPQSRKQYVFMMSSIQTIKTIMLDICSNYYLDHFPQDQLFVSSTERLGKKWRTRRFEPMLNASGARERRSIGAFTENKKSGRSGETMYSIEYDGKVLDIGTSQSASSLSADTKRILLADEIARWPADTGGEGHPWQIALGRITAWMSMGKAMGVSSPLIDEECKMQELHGTGDERLFQAVCPYCGKGQFLERGTPEANYGLKFPTKGGNLLIKEIHYQCDFCHEPIFEHMKTRMLQKIQPRSIRKPEKTSDRAIWIPQSTPDEDWIVSYQIGGLYSPFISWRKYVSEYKSALKKPEKMQAFVNQRDGLPFKIVGLKPDIEKIGVLKGTYKSGEIPHEVLFLTASVDVQHGQENWESNDKLEKPRLELEIKGHGDGYRQFSIQYEVFEGYLEDIYSGAWGAFREFLDNGGFVFKARNLTYDVKLCLIDVRSAKYTDQTYSFCRENGVTKFSPSMGFNTLSRDKEKSKGKDDSDKTSHHDWLRYKREQENDIILYKISTFIYKTALFSRLNTSINFVKDKPGERTPPGFCGFPSDYSDHYFDMLLSEEYIPGLKGNQGKFKQIKKRNESLDLTVYNMAAGEIWLYQQLVLIRAKFSAMNAPAAMLTGITTAFIIKMLKSQKAKGRTLTTAEIKQQLKTGK